MTLYVIATPIGNLGDITIRAKEVLAQATLIVAEDTRTAGKLLQLLGITGEQKKEFVSSHAQSTGRSRTSAVVRCAEHEHIALVTDAGTPTISDPGALFVDEFRQTYPDALVIPVPGVAAAIAALSVSGFPASHFEFLGFVPHKKGRETFFKKIANTEHTIVFYESPHRILKTLQSLSEVLGNRMIMVGREMTKQFEEYPRGTATALLEYYTAHPDKVRGEYVIVVAPIAAKDSTEAEKMLN
jgi:16S rRNA (cytidine1402-2'-O)-methyltransferase